MNSPVQGSAADIIKIAMLKVYRRLKKECPKAKLLLQIHDELLIEAIPEEIEQVKSKILYKMDLCAKACIGERAKCFDPDTYGKEDYMLRLNR